MVNLGKLSIENNVIRYRFGNPTPNSNFRSTISGIFKLKMEENGNYLCIVDYSSWITHSLPINTLNWILNVNELRKLIWSSWKIPISSLKNPCNGIIYPDWSLCKNNVLFVLLPSSAHRHHFLNKSSCLVTEQQKTTTQSQWMAVS